MKLIATISLLLLATATGLTLYLPTPNSVSVQPAFVLDSASLRQPLNYADFSLVDWHMEPNAQVKVGLLVALVSSPQDAQSMALQWQQWLTQQRLPAHSLTLFSLQSKSQRAASQALVMGPFDTAEPLSTYQTAALGEPFANQLVQWPTAKETTL